MKNTAPFKNMGRAFALPIAFHWGFSRTIGHYFPPLDNASMRLLCVHSNVYAFVCIDVDNRLRRRMNRGCIEIFAKSWNCVEKKN